MWPSQKDSFIGKQGNSSRGTWLPGAVLSKKSCPGCRKASSLNVNLWSENGLSIHRISTSAQNPSSPLPNHKEQGVESIRGEYSYLTVNRTDPSAPPPVCVFFWRLRPSSPSVSGCPLYIPAASSQGPLSFDSENQTLNVAAVLEGLGRPAIRAQYHCVVMAQVLMGTCTSPTKGSNHLHFCNKKRHTSENTKLKYLVSCKEIQISLDWRAFFPRL